MTLHTARKTEMDRYLIVIEKTETGFSAYSPDLPGCVPSGVTRHTVRRLRDRVPLYAANGPASFNNAGSNLYFESATSWIGRWL